MNGKLYNLFALHTIKVNIFINFQFNCLDKYYLNYSFVFPLIFKVKRSNYSTRQNDHRFCKDRNIGLPLFTWAFAKLLETMFLTNIYIQKKITKVCICLLAILANLRSSLWRKISHMDHVLFLMSNKSISYRNSECFWCILFFKLFNKA